jgi:hypothetical protein
MNTERVMPTQKLLVTMDEQNEFFSGIQIDVKPSKMVPVLILGIPHIENNLRLHIGKSHKHQKTKY